MDLIEQLNHFLSLKKRYRWNHTTQLEYENFCFSLTESDAEILTNYAVSLENNQEALDILNIIAVTHPTVLHGVQDKYLEDWRIYSSHLVLFRGANAETRDKLFSTLRGASIRNGISTKTNLENTLNALMWIGDDVVKEQLQQWLIHEPDWATKLDKPVWKLPHIAGWELKKSGTVVDLTFSEAFVLSDEETPIVYEEERCENCNFPLQRFVDLDLTDPNLDFLGLKGERLHLRGCTNCWSPNLFVEFDAFGNCKRSGFSGKQWMVEPGSREEPKISVSVPMRPVRKLPSPLMKVGNMSGSWLVLGGHPFWITVDYQQCPNCKQTMKFLISYPDDPPDIDGLHYLSICKDCHLATMDYQEH